MNNNPFVIYFPWNPPKPPKKPKLLDPPAYTGENDPQGKELRSFLSRCVEHFRNEPDIYATDDRKVVFAGSHLKEAARRWWEPFLLAEPPHPATQDWGLFVEALNNWQGDPDIQSTAQTKLQNLRMPPNAHIRDWIAEFYSWAPLTGYNNAALARAFYDMLPRRIKERFINAGRPSNLDDLVQRAREYDYFYWQDEHTHRASTTQSTSSSTSAAPTTRNNARPTSQANQSAPAKLSEAERKRRMDNNLCLYCGEAGHIRANCPKRPSTSATPQSNNTRVARATFNISSDASGATISEVSSDTPQSENAQGTQ